jgi:hypothetical protein
MDRDTNEVGLNVRVPEGLRYAIRRHALDQRTTVAELVNRLLEAELARAGANAAVTERR